jgi:hypothetical protein
MKFRGIFGLITFLAMFSPPIARAQQIGLSAPQFVSPVQPFVSAPVQPFVSAPVQPFVSAPVQPFVSGPVQPFVSSPVAPPVVPQVPGFVSPDAVGQMPTPTGPVIVLEPVQTFSPRIVQGSVAFSQPVTDPRFGMAPVGSFRR